MVDDSLTALIYENQNRMMRTGGTRRYLDDRLKSAFPSRPIKVVVGFRRSGKSWLCLQVARELVENGQFGLGDVLILNFEDYRLSDIRSPEDLDRVLGLFRSLSPNPGKKLILLDEIQIVPGWDRFLRTLYERNENLELVVTGSNAELLSSEFAERLAGRHISFELLPFSFAEVLANRKVMVRTEADYFRNLEAIQDLWNEFIELGGLPERFSIVDPMAVKSYLGAIFSKVILDDVIKRYRVEQVAALEQLARFVLSSPGQILSFASAARKLAAWGAAIKQDTVILYIGYLKSAFALFDISRLDWKTGRHFDTTRKYYAVDTGLAALFRSTAENRSFLLENAVYLELRRRGHEVRFGAIENGKELDFICALPGHEWLKIQTTRRLTDENKSRELASFVLAQEYVAPGEALLLLEEGGRQIIERNGVPIRVEPVIRWMLGL